MELSNGLSNLFDQFVKEKRYMSNLSESTLESCQQVFNRFEKYAGGFPSPDTLSQFVVGMRQAGLSVTTCNLSIRSFNSFLTWLKEHKHTQEYLKIKRLKEEKKVMRTFSAEPLKALTSWKPTPGSRNEVRLYAVLCTLADPGIRINEALTIELCSASSRIRS